MSGFDGTSGNDVISFLGGVIQGFDGTLGELSDNSDDIFSAGDGNDSVGAGNTDDTLLGEGGNDDLKGGGGDDRLDGGFGTDTLAGGDGNDEFFMEANQEIDDVAGGNGIDTLNFSVASPRGMDVDLIAGTWSMSDGFGGTRSISGIEVVLGTSTDDTVNSGTGNETITGNSGNDQIFGNAGNDVLQGGSDGDRLFGGSGNDSIFAFRQDNFDGSSVGDRLEGDTGSDSIIGSGGGDTIDGGSDNDILAGRSGDDRIAGDDGNDQMFGDAGNDTFDGGFGFDSINGGTGDDSFFVADNSGIDSIDGGSGNNTLDLSDIGSAGANIDLNGNVWNFSTGVGGTAFIDNIDVIIGTQRNDRIVTDINTQTFDGGAGNDTFVMIGTDIVVDNIDGGIGVDRLDLSAVTARGADINLATGFWELANVIGNPETIENVEIIVGTQANDTVVGSAVAETMLGGAGIDRLNGAGGNDVLTGGAARDILNGGGGLDRFDFNAIGESGKTSATRDVINGFTHLQDDLDFSTIDARAGVAGNQAFAFIGGANFTAEGQIRAVQVGADTILEINTTGANGAEMTIELSNFVANTLSVADFIF